MSLRDRTEQAENKAKFGETGHFGKKGGRSVWLWGYREGEASSVKLLVLYVSSGGYFLQEGLCSISHVWCD